MTVDPNTWEVKTKESEVQSHSKFEVSLSLWRRERFGWRGSLEMGGYGLNMSPRVCAQESQCRAAILGGGACVMFPS